MAKGVADLTQLLFSNGSHVVPLERESAHVFVQIPPNRAVCVVAPVA
jgi:hypothetical protein